MTVSCFTAIAGISLMKDSPKESYFPRAENIFDAQQRLSGGYADYMSSLRNNRKTGFISSQEVENAVTHAAKMKKADKALDINWRFKGPDNVGGRTRAILIDQADTNHIIAGAVSGGLWESFNGAVSWQPYDPDFKISNVSAIAQGSDGTIYVGTGNNFEGNSNSKNLGSDFVGTGLYKLTGNGNSDLLIGPPAELNYNVDWTAVNEIVVDPANSQRLLVATNRGLRESTDGGSTWTNAIALAVPCQDVEMTSDGKIFAAFPNSVYTSTDNGANYTPSFFSNSARIELAIAPSNTDIVYASIASTRGGCLLGVYRSNNSGQNWTQILNTPDYFSNVIQCQGIYDNEIIVFPDDAGKILVGGVSMFQWTQSSTDPAPLQGEWKVIATTNEFNGNNSRNPFYVHADKHKFLFHPTNSNKLYVGTDGGVGLSENMNSDFPTYGQYNLGYNVTQFYDIGVGPNDQVIAGAQDNGTQLIGLNFNTGRSAIQVRGGDGFESELFTINPTLGIASLYNGDIRRVQGIGTTLGSSNFSTAGIYSGTLANLCAAGQGCSNNFYTSLAIWESFAHTATKDSVLVEIERTDLPPLKAGTNIPFESKNGRWPLNGILNSDIFPLDTNSNDSAFIEAKKIGFGTDGLASFITAYDTIAIDTGNRTIEFRYRGQTAETRTFVFGVPEVYTNIFHSKTRLSVTVTDEEVLYQDPKIVFRYQTEFPDIVQSMVALPGVKGRTDDLERNVWISKDVLKGSNVSEPRWFKVAGRSSTPTPTPLSGFSSGSTTTATTFSKDGNSLFYGNIDGDLYRIDGLNDIDVSQISILADDDFVVDNITSHHKIGDFGNRAVTGITIDPQDPNNIIVTLGNYGQAQYVTRSTNAINATSTTAAAFESISGTGTDALPDAPVYEAMIDRRDHNKVLIATEIGVFGTENAFTANAADVAWTEENSGLGKVPVMSIKQMTFGSDVGAINEGKVYIGTHGRGVYETDQLVGIEDYISINSSDASKKPQLKVYPNPVQDEVNLELLLASNEVVSIQLYTITGQLVKEFTNKRVLLGKNTVNIDVRDLDRGTYIIRSVQNNEVGTTKFIKQ